MKKLIQQLLGESAIYGISSIITKFIGIFLVPLYTSVFTPADYGIINIVNSFFFFVGILTIFALDNSAARWFYDTEDEEDRKKTIASWFWFQLVATITISFLLVLSAGFLSDTFIHSSDKMIFIIPSLSIITGIIPTILSNWFRMRRQAVKTVIYSLTYSLVTIGFTVYFVLFLKLGVIGVFYAILISNLLASLYGITQLFSWIKIRYFDKKRIKAMLKFAFPLIPTSVAFWVINSSSAFVLEHYCSLQDVGLFQLGITIASAVSLFVTAFQMAWGPFAYSILDQPNAKMIYGFVLTGYSIITSMAALFVSLFALDLLKIFTTPAYYSAYVVAGILAFNATIYGYAYIVGIGNGIVKDNKPLAKGVLISSCITTILLFTLTPLWGKLGSAIAMLIGNSVIPIYVYFSAQKRYYIPYKAGVALFIYLYSIALFVIYLLLPKMIFIYDFLLKSFLILVFFTTLVLILRKYESDLFVRVASLIQRKFSKSQKTNI